MNESSRLEAFRVFREKMNHRILQADNLDIRRFFALDSRVYAEGVLVRCCEEGLTEEQLLEAMSVGLIVGGSIVIPHLRRAIATLDEIRAHPGAPGV